MMQQSLTIRDAIIQRRSIKAFNGQPVERETLLSIIEDSIWAPNHQIKTAMAICRCMRKRTSRII